MVAAAAAAEQEAAELDTALAGASGTKSRIDATILSREVKSLGKRWTLEGNDLRLEIVSRSVAKLATVVAQAGALADEMEIQPVIIVEPPRLYLTLRAHDGKALTVSDLVFAARLEQWMRETPWRG
jgi:pterin-4a-carbinolamine dehydratase